MNETRLRLAMTAVTLIIFAGCSGRSLGPWSGAREQVHPLRPEDVAAVKEYTAQQQARAMQRQHLEPQVLATLPVVRDVPPEIESELLAPLEKAVSRGLDKDSEAPPAVTLDDIEAIGRLNSHARKRQEYRQIAAAGLTEDCQIRLVHAIFDNLLSESAKEEVLLRLIHNPAFSPAAQTAILERLDNIVNESVRKRIRAVLPFHVRRPAPPARPEMLSHL